MLSELCIKGMQEDRFPPRYPNSLDETINLAADSLLLCRIRSRHDFRCSDFIPE
jgi:hypothetical protein